MVRVLYEQGNRRARCFSRHHAAQDLHSILFDLHSSPGAVAFLTARKFFIDDVRCEGKPCGHTIKDGS
jgi:hypothetical protein